MGGDEIDGVGKLRMVAPDVPDFARRHRNIDRLLDPLDQLDEPMNVVFRKRPFQRVGLLVRGLRFRIPNPLAFLAKYSRGLLGFEPGLGYRPKVLDRDLFAAVDGFVADHDADDVAVVPREIDGGFDLAIVAIAVLVDPGADRDLHAEFRGDRRHQFVAFRRRVQADRARQGGELLQIGANLLGVGDDVGDGVTRFKRRVGKRSAECPGSRAPAASPGTDPKAQRERRLQTTERRRRRASRLNHTGPIWQGSGSVPEIRPSQRQVKHISATRFNNSYDADGVLRAQHNPEPRKFPIVPVAGWIIWQAPERGSRPAAAPRPVRRRGAAGGGRAAGGVAAAAACGWAAGLIQQA